MESEVHISSKMIQTKGPKYVMEVPIYYLMIYKLKFI